MFCTPMTSVRALRAAAVAGALLVPAIGAAPAGAAPATDAVCTNVLTVDITPGWRLAPGPGIGSSHGETGTQVCIGTLYGHRITGPGTVGVEEHITGSCLSDTSAGTVSVTLPTTAGIVHLAGALQAHRLGLVQFVDIAFPDARFTGMGPGAPTRGDCLLRPITQVTVSLTGTLSV
jgi:hypothetical protein